MKKKGTRVNRKRLALFTTGLALGLLIMVLLPSCTPPPEMNPGNGKPDNEIRVASVENQRPVTSVAGVPQIDPNNYVQIPLTEFQLEVSSTNHISQGKENLSLPGTVGFWHVKTPKEEARPWVKVDMKTQQTLAVFGILGRQGADQLWQGYRAVLEASNDGENWEILARLGLRATPPTSEWVYFYLPEPNPYRYYRFSTHDWNFMSMARIAMYVPLGSLSPLPATSEPKPLQIQGTSKFDLSPYARVPLTESQLEVSSVEGEALGKANLVKPGTKGFWHVKMPRQEGQEWVLVDLGIEQAIPLLRVRPRSGYPDHFWYGYTADLEASNDKHHWTTIAVLGVPRAELTGDWLNFLVGNLEPYRYYRLSVCDEYFLSLARLEIYEFRQEALK